jgi:hypothetical protein
MPFQAHALNRDEPQNAVWCGQHRILQAQSSSPVSTIEIIVNAGAYCRRRSTRWAEVTRSTSGPRRQDPAAQSGIAAGFWQFSWTDDWMGDPRPPAG